jgi:hypothetical protein
MTANEIHNWFASMLSSVIRYYLLIEIPPVFLLLSLLCLNLHPNRSDVAREQDSSIQIGSRELATVK